MKVVGSLEEFTTFHFSNIWGSLRNLIDFEKVEIPTSVRLVGSVHGEFPVDAYFPIFLEISKDYVREDLSGRFSCAGMDLGQKYYDSYWHPARTIPLPLFENDPELGVHGFLEGYCQLLDRWIDSPIPDNLPCAAIAIKTKGNYCEEREAQWILVLLLWPNNSARVLALELFEGALEDCISPEWYLNVSKLMPVDTAIEEIRKSSMNLPKWERPSSSLFVQPVFLGCILNNGKKESNEVSHWKHEWVYDRNDKLIEDLSLLLDEFHSIMDHS
ncbi:hypothetical protein EU527_05485 [Candidatus Thorarchaeota archaeon]|nr:MAG: hypothetical protein EU527_05485 [Candidatus Thorarchaeota archaeon]